MISKLLSSLFRHKNKKIKILHHHHKSKDVYRKCQFLNLLLLITQLILSYNFSKKKDHLFFKSSATNLHSKT